MHQVNVDYQKLIASAVTPQNASWIRATSLNNAGKLIPAIAWAPIETAFASDSIMLYAQYDQQIVEEFLRRAALLFCAAIRCEMPLRGAISLGDAVFDRSKNVFIGQPLIEASSLEAKLEHVGVALARSMRDIPLPPHLVQIAESAVKLGAEELQSGALLDWPRVWRGIYADPPGGYLKKMEDAAESEPLKLRYQRASEFVDHSARNAETFMQEGMTMITVDSVWEAAGWRGNGR